MKKYNLINNISGWGVFAISAVTYLLTIEPTASLWDCGEFIASGFKLQVGHPPGNPVFMIMTRFFTLFAGGDVTKVSAMVNAMSALASAFTILFLFWTITHLAKKLVINKDEAEISLSGTIAVMFAGAVGALAYCFSDSFWFSAVEGEVYAMSSFFTAIVVWAALKWEDTADEPYADRWLILIAFLMGLSIGVHLLNLLTLPAIVLVYYFRKYEFSWKGLVVSLAVSVVALALLMYGIMPGIVTISSRFDMFFVNQLGLSPNTGMTFHVVLTALLLMLAIKFSLSSNVSKNIIVTTAALFFTGIWIISGSGFLNILVFVIIAIAVYYAASRNNAMLNMIMTMIAVILIGYSSNAIIVIRSAANPPLNENNPSNPFNLLYFINREQYGDRPLFKGAYYNAPVLDYKDGKARYSLEDGKKYIETSRSIERIYDSRFETLFPRMWSDQSDHRQIYEELGGIKGTPIQVTNSSGEKSVIRKPTFIENLRFMMSYQYGYMYFRYFMWNFSGRQNDTQGTGGALNGNWITGINSVDNKLNIGTIADAPDDIKNDPSRNKYYLLPFILGLAGLLYHLNNEKRDWSIIMLLFVMTGIAIVFYLNQYPNQPRERDYAYVGSFYFFAAWIGLGVIGLYEAFSKLTGKTIAAPLAGALCCIIPVIMAAENWDDHNRSGRYLARDVAFNYLNSCAPNAILFTNGDNDTFPLWYAQEVEGKRTDLRVCNLMLLNTDWYIDQMKRRTYESAPLPISLPAKKYYDGINNQVFIVERTKEPVNISTVIEWVNSDNMATKVQVSTNEKLDIIPSRTIRIPIDADKVIASGTVKPEDRDQIVPYIDITLKGNSIIKSQLIVLDILANNNWERPIYFVAGYHNDTFGLEEYFQLEGLAYRLIPVRTQNRSWIDYGRIDADILYDNMMNKFAWSGANEPKVYIDHYLKRTLIVTRARLNHARLAKALAERDDNEKAVEVLDRCMNLFPLSNIPYDPYFGDLIDAYFQAGAVDKATEMAIAFKDYYFERLSYFINQNPYVLSSAEYEIQSAIQFTAKVADSCEKYAMSELATEINDRLEVYYAEYMARLQQNQ